MVYVRRRRRTDWACRVVHVWMWNVPVDEVTVLQRNGPRDLDNGRPSLPKMIKEEKNFSKKCTLNSTLKVSTFFLFPSLHLFILYTFFFPASLREKRKWRNWPRRQTRRIKRITTTWSRANIRIQSNTRKPSQ